MSENRIQKHVESPFGKVFYWIKKSEDPSAECIFFLHGLTADHTLFDKQMEHFGGTYTVIVWDAPSHGKSRPYLEFSYANGAEDIRAILTAEGIVSAYMVGQSMGGYFVQAFLLKYPQMVKAFIGIDTCPFGLKYYTKSDLWWLRQIGWMSRCYPYKSLVNSIVKSVSVTEYARHNMLEALKPYSKKELCTLMGMGYASFVKENCDMKIDCPVLVLVGEYDRTGKVRHYCQQWHESEKYPLHMIKNAAYNSNADNYTEVNNEIERFITRVLSGS